jgi:uncharacterized protein HemY
LNPILLFNEGKVVASLSMTSSMMSSLLTVGGAVVVIVVVVVLVVVVTTGLARSLGGPPVGSL